MSRGKSIRIYLADGTATGIRHAELVNWTGQAIACPRNRIGELSSWQESNRPGVYILFGFEDTTGESLAYIGEAENVFSRLQEHVAKKDFWNEVVFFTSKDENLTKAHVRYLESKFIEIANNIKRYKLENGNTPGLPSLPRSDLDSMEDFIEQARGLPGVLGHKIFEPTVQVTRKETAVNIEDTISEQSNSIIGTNLFLNIRNIHAEAVLTDEGIVVLPGSVVSKTEMDSLSAGYKRIRRKLVSSEILADNGDHFIFNKEYLFSSPSSAAAVIVGYSINGRRQWKDKNGKTLSFLEGDGY